VKSGNAAERVSTGCGVTAPCSLIAAPPERTTTRGASAKDAYLSRKAPSWPSFALLASHPSECLSAKFSSTSTETR
jgi:hypothetical protein